MAYIEPLQMRAVRRARLRESADRESKQTGELQIGQVITVLEKVTDQKTNIARVRCSDGWTSVVSRSGNCLLQSI